MMDELIKEMKIGLASVFSFYLKIQYFHWNIEGPNFPQYHTFFGDLYEEVHGSIDQYAEQIRALGSYSPGSLGRFKELSVVEDEINIPNSASMIRELLLDNQRIIDLLEKINSMANENNKSGLSNFIEDRIDKHNKHGWMLRSISKG
jgi:starvation-inducible DNA-binding protein